MAKVSGNAIITFNVNHSEGAYIMLHHNHQSTLIKRKK